VCYTNDGESLHFKITIPENTKAIFKYKNKELALTRGENSFKTEL